MEPTGSKSIRVSGSVKSSIKLIDGFLKRLQLRICWVLGLLGGSWVVRVEMTGIISPRILVVTMVTLLITPLITTHEPPQADP